MYYIAYSFLCIVVPFFLEFFRPMFSVLSSLYPSIPHFAIEESAIKPRYSSDYFLRCTAVGIKIYLDDIITSDIYLQHVIEVWSSWISYSFLLNSSMRVRYQGSRSLGSLTAFYGDITGTFISCIYKFG